MGEHFGKCALCWNETVLELSHIVPKLVIRELKKTSVGAIRNTANPNGTVQDGEKITCFVGTVKICSMYMKQNLQRLYFTHM